jgi:hypothetical protein
LVQYPNLTQVVIILKETLAVQSKPYFHGFSAPSVSFILPTPTSSGEGEAEVDVDANSEIDDVGETRGSDDGHHSSQGNSSEVRGVASANVSSTASGEQFDDEKGSKILLFSVEVLRQFLDLWAEVYGDMFSSLIIHDELGPQRWKKVLPILSTRVQNIELVALSLSAAPPAFPKFHSFNPPRCTHCHTE